MTRFVVDSSADMLRYKDAELVSVPMSISTSERTFTDDALLDTQELLEYMEKYKGRSFTACPGTQAWLDAFKDADVIYVGTLTSSLSGTYNSALTAKEIYLEEHPDAKIHVFDSLSTGPELRLLMEKLVELDKEGIPFEEVVDKAYAYLYSTKLFFSFQSLHNLAQNGRINKVIAATIGALNIRIVGQASLEGTIEPLAKRKGDKHAAAEIMHQLQLCGFDGGKVRICHTDNKALALKYAHNIQEKYPDSDIKVYESRGLISYYAERGGIIIGVETNPELNIENTEVSEETEE